MKNNISYIRKQIAQADQTIIKQLARRASLVRRLGTLKRNQKLPVTDVRRERNLKILHQRWAAELGLDSSKIKKIFGFIIDDAKKAQKRL